MFKAIYGDAFKGPVYQMDGKTSTRWYHVTWVPEEEYPFPLVTSRYLLDYKVEGEGSHVVLLKNRVVKVGTWQECSARADQKQEAQGSLEQAACCVAARP